MGICVTICKTPIKAHQEVNIEGLNNNGQQNYTHSPNYPKIIYLQLRIKNFLKKIKTSNKKRISSKGKNNNINVNINLNVNMNSQNNIIEPQNSQNNTNLIQNSTISFSKKTQAINKSQNNNNYNNNNVNNNQEGSILIPAVRPEFKESLIFSQDPFIKGKKIQLSSNDPRDGPFDNERHLFPKIVEDESSYEGEWKNGKRDGIGILCWKNISKFIGEFIDDRVNGFGKLWHEDGDIYTGYWNDFQAEGIGYYKTQREASYEGYWKNDKQNGFGIEKWPRGSNYIGEYEDGNKHGIGILNFDGNGGYEGEFQFGNIAGIGTFSFKDKRHYTGEWKNNKMHGFGIIAWPDGKFFEGEFVDDKKEGFGVFYSHKKIYMGIWKNSLLEGEIIIIDGDRLKKQLWENGRPVENLPPDRFIFFEKYVNEIIDFKEKVENILKNQNSDY